MWLVNIVVMYISCSVLKLCYKGISVTLTGLFGYLCFIGEGPEMRDSGCALKWQLMSQLFFSFMIHITFMVL